MKFRFTQNIIPVGSTLRDVMRTLDISPIGIVFFIDDDKRLKGIMTDGDARRAVLKGCSLDKSTEELMIKNYIYGKVTSPRKENEKLLSDEIRHLPVLDKDGRIADFISIIDFVRYPVSEPVLPGNELKYIMDCIERNWISSQGDYVIRFQNAFAQYHDIPYALTVSNGTAALHLALKALNVGPGDEVIVPDLTFGACGNAVIHAGADPVFVDIKPDTWNIDVTLIEEKITDRTKAVMPVHLYGRPCDMDPILDIARRYNLYIVEDCAEALGAQYKGQRVGTFGDIGCFSFFANKVITTGEGGMLITRQPALRDSIEILRDHGMKKDKRYWHSVVGFNYRMTNLQAAVGLAQMEQIESFIEKRREISILYKKELDAVRGIVTPDEIPYAESICWFFSILIDENEFGMSKDRLALELQKEGIETRPLFYPLHMQPAFLQKMTSFPVAERISVQGLSLPTSSNMSANEVQRICGIIRKIHANSKLMKEFVTYDSVK